MKSKYKKTPTQTPNQICIIGRDVFITIHNLRENPLEDDEDESPYPVPIFSEEHRAKVKRKPISIKTLAKVDTGAYSSSISKELARKLGLHDQVPEGTKTIKSASGTTNRQFYKVDLVIGNRRIRTEVNIADRSNLEYEMLLGRIDISAFQALVNVRKTEIVTKKDAPSKNENKNFVKGFGEFINEMDNHQGAAVTAYWRGMPDPNYPVKTEFDVVLKEVGSERLRVIIELRKLYGESTWAEAKKVADSTPVVIAEKVSKERAEEILNTFEFIGANIEIK